MAITLKTAKRASSVPRASIKNAVSVAYRMDTPAQGARRTATVTKKEVSVKHPAKVLASTKTK